MEAFRNWWKRHFNPKLLKSEAENQALYYYVNRQAYVINWQAVALAALALALVFIIIKTRKSWNSSH